MSTFHFMKISCISALGIFFLLLFSGSVKAQRLTDLEENELRDSVRSVYRQSFAAGLLNGRLMKHYRVDGDSLIFNEKGCYLETNRYDQGEQAMAFNKKYQYDSIGHLKEVVETNQLRSSKVVYKMTCDSLGNTLEENIYVDEQYADFKGLSTRYVYTYNAMGQKTRMDCYNLKNGGGLSFSESYSYNERGDLLRTETIGDHICTSVAYEYCYNEKGFLEKKTTIHYDRELKESKFVVFYIRNTEDIVIEEHYYKIMQPMYNGCVFELDTHGNWIKQVYYEYGKVTYVTERKIEYYGEK